MGAIVLTSVLSVLTLRYSLSAHGPGRNVHHWPDSLHARPLRVARTHRCVSTTALVRAKLSNPKQAHTISIGGFRNCLAAHSLTGQGAFRRRTGARLPLLGPHLAHARSPAQSPIFVAFIVAVHIVVGGRSPYVHRTEVAEAPTRTHARTQARTLTCTHTAMPMFA